MAMTPAERKRRQRERDKRLGMATFQMELAESERHSIRKGASRMGFVDQTEYLLSLVYADLKRPAKLSCNYPSCDCPFDLPEGAACMKGYEMNGVTDGSQG
ncbi:hypothetical protein [Marinobacter sp. X15-166B]|uniref:hypothetical protein n=1 Tax=Marinobacter sp. X15-166B TaxID=1897620 RepID=UPI00085C9A19|nr:hypothetical protein [Marinobacter sp. X15-166B]OEY66832.1 hypothetical protein BG841_10440 [Marinobacter sp. X15-166B]